MYIQNNQSTNEQYSVYAQQMDSAKTYTEWATAASALDKLDGNIKLSKKKTDRQRVE